MTRAQILVVEDELLVAEDVRRKLARLGYGVPAVAVTGEEAIRLAAELRPNLVLMDIGLPGKMNGVDTADEIRTRFDIPIAYLTAHSDEDTLARAKHTGPYGYVLKPFDSRDLRSTLEMALYKHEQETKLRASEERYHGLFDSAPVGLYRTTPTGQIVDANPALVEMLGCPDRATLLALNVSDACVHATDRARWQARMEREGIISGFEMQVRRRDGETIWVRDAARAVRDADGRVLYYDGILEDITERKRAADALRESEERFRHLYEQAPLGYQSLDMEGRFIDVNQAWLDQMGYSREEVIGRWFGDFLVPREVTVFQERFPRFLASGETHVDLEMVRRAGSTIVVHIDGRIGRDERGQFKQTHCILHDITERKKADEALCRSLAETERARQMLLALGQAAEAVQRAHTPEEVYRTIGDEVTRLGYHATVFTLTDNRAHLVLARHTFEPATVRAAEKLTGLPARGYNFPLTPGSYYHRILTDGKPVLDDSVAQALADALPRPLRRLADRLAAMLGLGQAIYVPLRVSGETVGLLTVMGKNLTEADLPAMSAFANQASIALENARLFEQVRTARGRLESLSRRLLDAQETERRHIARELHDEIGQALTVIKINLQAAQRALETPILASYLADSIRTVEGTLQQVRGLSLDLRPSLLDDLGLAPALRWYVDRQACQAGFTAHFASDPLAQRLPPELEIACFRIVQEALTNVMRHAQAREVSVEVRRGEEGLNLVISDDGLGFDVLAALTGAAQGESMGLLGMEERVQILGGRIEIESAPGAGTEIQVHFPETLFPAAGPNDEKEEFS